MEPTSHSQHPHSQRGCCFLYAILRPLSLFRLSLMMWPVLRESNPPASFLQFHAGRLEDGCRDRTVTCRWLSSSS